MGNEKKGLPRQASNSKYNYYEKKHCQRDKANGIKRIAPIHADGLRDLR